MGIYSSNVDYIGGGVLPGIDMNEQITPALESANFTAMSFEVCAEAEANYNKFMKAIGVNELNYFEENGQEIVYEAGGTGFLETVKKFFINLWNKIKGIFHKFFVWLESFTKSNRDFAKKYEKEARERWNDLDDDFSIKGFKFTHLENNTTIYTQADHAMAAVISNLTAKDNILNGISGTADVYNKLSAINKNSINETTIAGIRGFNTNYKDNASEYKERVRAAILASLKANKSTGGTNDNGQFSESELADELFEYFRDGERSPDTIDKKDLNLEDSISRLKTYEKTKKTADANFKETKKSYDDLVKNLEKVQKTLSNITDSKDRETEITKGAEKETVNWASEFTSCVSNITELVKTARQANIAVNGALLQALKDQAAQDKRLMASVITTGKVRKESTNYSGYSYNSESATSMDFLSGINFV